MQIFRFYYQGYPDLLTWEEWFFSFYKRDAATYRLLNCLGETPKMSYKKHFSDKIV